MSDAVSPLRQNGRRARGFVLMSLVVGTSFLIVWTAYLGWVLPRAYVAAHWKLAWVGLDTGQVVVLLLTTWAAYRGRLVVIIFANVAATMFVIDAWFDVTTARSGAFSESLFSAFGVELPAAGALIWVAWSVLRRAVNTWGDENERNRSIWQVNIPAPQRSRRRKLSK